MIQLTAKAAPSAVCLDGLADADAICRPEAGGRKAVPRSSRHAAITRTCISLRVPAGRSFSVEDCVASGSLIPGAAQFLSRMIEAKLAFLISGGIGSGTRVPSRRW